VRPLQNTSKPRHLKDLARQQQHRRIDHLAVHTERAALGLHLGRQHALGPSAFGFGWGQGLVHARHLRGVDAQLGKKAKAATESSIKLASMVMVSRPSISHKSCFSNVPITTLATSVILRFVNLYLIY